ncbi:hypothetical protein AAG906_029254 [Vitis piasezkii]
MRQGYEDHLVTPEDAIPDVDKMQWKKINAQLCSVLWQSVDPNILHHLRAYKTCFKFWTRAKGLYTNDIQRFYKVVSDIVHVRQQDMDLSTYIGRIASLKEEFLTLMPFTNGAKAQQIQTNKFFMVLTLIGLRPHLESTLSTDGPSDSSVLASQTNSPGGRSGNRDRCYQLHGGLLVHIAQSSDPLLSRPDSAASPTSQSITLSGSDYDAYLRYQAATSVFVASVTQTGNISVCFTQSPSLGPWILDSEASDHISGNKHLFSSITTTSALPTVTLANGSQTMAKGIGLAHPLPSLPLHYDRSTRKTIGIGRESQGLYHLTSPSSPAACISTNAPLLIHNRPGHPSLSSSGRWSLDKLSAKAMKCIFLGYSRLQKGYRCYSPDTHRYFLSANVTFFEDSPFFSSSESLPIFEVYHRRHRVVTPPLSSAEVPDDSPPVPPISPTPALSSTNHLPIALRKSNRSTRNPHPIYNFLSYHRLSSSYSTFVSTLSSVSLLKSTSEALSHPGWRQAMVDEMAALHSNGTWDLVSLPPGKSTVGCRWVYTIKVVLGYGCDYGDTFSPVAKIASFAYFYAWQLCVIGLFIAWILRMFFFVVNFSRKCITTWFCCSGGVCLVCKLRRSLYGLKQSPRAWFGHFSSVVQEFGMLRSEADHSVFYHHNSSSQCIYLVVYVDDIVITGSDQEGIQRLKQHLFNHFQTKDLGKLKYFLGLEIAQSSSGVVMSQRKYALDILEETGMLECKPVDTPMDPNVKLLPGQGSL